MRNGVGIVVAKQPRNHWAKQQLWNFGELNENSEIIFVSCVLSRFVHSIFDWKIRNLLGLS